MNRTDCPELEVLYFGVNEGDQDSLAHARDCEACAAALEAHRQLEKDLFRIVDPLPPVNLVAQVMAKVAAAPVPASREAWTGFGILLVSVALLAGVAVSSGQSLGDVGVWMARALIAARTLFIAVGNALQALWGTAALPLVATSLFVLASSLLGLRRLAGATQRV